MLCCQFSDNGWILTFALVEVFITFMESLKLCLRTSLPMFFLALSLFATSLATTGVLMSNKPSRWRTNATESAVDFTKNDLLLGAQDSFFWFLVPLFGLISIGVCVVVNYAALAIVHLFSHLYPLLTRTTGYIKHEYKRYGWKYGDGGTGIVCWHWSRNSRFYSPPSPRQRLINTSILLFLVWTVIPYQFAYVVACIVQLATCSRASWHARETVSTHTSPFLFRMLLTLYLGIEHPL